MTIVEKPWGSYKVLAEGNGFKMKVLHIKRGELLSYQRHKFRKEIWFVSEGSGFLKYSVGDELPRERELFEGQTVVIKPNDWHSVKAVLGDMTIVELQIGEICSEDDIERKYDRYGRV